MRTGWMKIKMEREKKSYNYGHLRVEGQCMGASGTEIPVHVKRKQPARLTYIRQTCL